MLEFRCWLLALVIGLALRCRLARLVQPANVPTCWHPDRSLYKALPMPQVRPNFHSVLLNRSACVHRSCSGWLPRMVHTPAAWLSRVGSTTPQPVNFCLEEQAHSAVVGFEPAEACTWMPAGSCCTLHSREGFSSKLLCPTQASAGSTAPCGAR